MGSHSSSSTASTSQNFNFNNLDYGSSSGGNTATALAKNVNLANSKLKIGSVSTTDHGAIAQAGKVATAAVKSSGQVSTQALNTADQMTAANEKFAYSVLNSSIQAVNAGQKQANTAAATQTANVLKYAQSAKQTGADSTTQNLFKYMIIGTVVIGGFAMVMAMRKK